MSDAAPGDGAPAEPPVAAPQQPQPIQITDTTELERVLTSTTFVIEKKLSTVAQEPDASVESAYLAEDKTKKEPYNLIIKIDDATGPLGKEIQGNIRIGNNFEFKLEPNETTSLYYYIPIQYTITVPDATNTNSDISSRIYIYCITNVRLMVNGANKGSADKIFMIEAKREKTSKTDIFKSVLPSFGLTGKYTSTQMQFLKDIEPKLLELLKTLIPVPTTGGDEVIKQKIAELNKLWTTGIPILNSTSLFEASKAILSLLESGLIDTSKIPRGSLGIVVTDELIRTMTSYRNTIGVDEIPFRLRMKRVSSLPPFRYENDAEYAEQYGEYTVRKDLLYNLHEIYKRGIQKYMLDDTNYNKVKTATKSSIDKRVCIEYMNYLYTLYEAFPNSKKGSGLLKGVARTLNPFTLRTGTGVFGGSIKYQQKRYKVYEREDGAKYINLDKKNYTLKVSSKGTYITRDGKRQYL